MTTKISYKNTSLFICTLVSLILLPLGVFTPIFTIQGELFVPIIGKLDLGTNTRSIWGTVRFLYESKNHLVATLILFFSVTIPVVKSVLLLWILVPLPSRLEPPKKVLLLWLSRIGKWAMADVFVVAVFLAYLATSSMKVFHAKLESGFYFFLSYCIFSMVIVEATTLKYDYYKENNS